MPEAKDNATDDRRQIPAIKVKQWLPEWDNVNFDPDENQRRPEQHFYLFSISAALLRKQSGINRRNASDTAARIEDQGIQRRHDPDRSAEIRRYVSEGYPRSTLNEAQRDDPENDGLRKPGWLPTAVVVNILQPGNRRSGSIIPGEQAIEVVEGADGTSATIVLPNDIDSNVPPIEIIDGQHRLFAFEDDDTADFELPVVAFLGLDISWQAYLFWTINIKPKKINASLAFDLYPLLREQEWLESGDKILVYRESRAQELTETLWANPESPWYRRINMLGGPRKESGPVTQAAFIRSLLASMVKPWKPRGRQQTGGIFGGTPNQDEGLAWSRAQQAAFLLEAWRLMAQSVQETTAGWAVDVREAENVLNLTDDLPRSDKLKNPAFAGSYSFLATDQGVRGFQQVINDLLYIKAEALNLSRWRDSGNITDMSPENLRRLADSMPDSISQFLSAATTELSTFDWRTSGFPGLNASERLAKSALRGSSGYKELRDQLITHLAECSQEDGVARAARLLKGSAK